MESARHSLSGLRRLVDGAAAPDSLAALRRFAPARQPSERCELCGTALPSEHSHLLDRQSRQVVCSCDTCSILFCGQQEARFLRVPHRIQRLDGVVVDDLQWEAMMLPIHLAFFIRQPDDSTVAMYPSPAGAMQSLVPLPAWNELFGSAPALRDVEPEVEAFITNRVGQNAQSFIAPIDSCYRLVGLIRTRWHGLSGGAEVGQAIAQFFADLDNRAQPQAVRHA